MAGNNGFSVDAQGNFVNNLGQVASGSAAQGGLLAGQTTGQSGPTREQILAFIQKNPAAAGDANNPYWNLMNPVGDSGVPNNGGATSPFMYNVPGAGQVQYDPKSGQLFGGVQSPFGMASNGWNPLTQYNSPGSTGQDASFTRQKSILEQAAPYVIGAGGLAIGAGALGAFGGLGAASAGGGADALAASGALEGGGGAALGGAGVGGLDAGALLPGVGNLGGVATASGGTIGGLSGASAGGLLGSAGTNGAVGGLDANGLGPNPGSNLGSISGATSGLLNGLDPSLLKAGAGLLGGLVGGVSGSNAPNSTTSTTQNVIDPRMANILYGADGKSGVLNNLAAQGSAPQNAGLAAAGNAASNYAGAFTASDMESQRAAAARLMAGNTAAPSMQAAQATQTPGITGATVAQTPAMQAAQVAQTPAMQAAQINSPQAVQAALAQASAVNAPSQNNVDLTSSYQKFINGNSAEDPYLTGAIGKGINQSTNAFQAQQQASTDNLMKNILPSIRSNAILSGQYGSSRQGVAEGNAIGDFTKAQQQALSQFGQNNTDAAVSAQSGAYNAGQDRALSATTGLGAQQYGVAQQNSAQQQQTAIANANAQNQVALANQAAQTGVDTNNAQLQQQAGQTNYQGLLSGNLANAGYQQGAASNNYAGTQASNLANAGYTQGANINNYAGTQATNLANAGFNQGAASSNLQSQLGTNTLNSNNTQAGINATGGLLSGAYGTAQAADAYDLNKTGKVAGLLGPYVNANATQTNTNPLYTNTAGNVLGGVTAGLGIYNAFR